MTDHSSFGLKEKLILISVGAIFGILVLAVFAWYRTSLKTGSEFASIDEVRRAMLGTDATPREGGVSLRSIVTPHPSDSLIYDLRPNLQVEFQGVPVSTNSCGMRDREREILRPRDTLRIALLGDSFAFGWGVEAKDNFASRIEQRLNSVHGALRPVEVLNFGVPGFSTFQEVALFKEKALDFDPDVILVYFVDNDFGFPFFIHDNKSPGAFVSATDFARRIWRGPDAETQAQHVALLKNDPGSALRTLAEIGSERGIKIVVAINPQKDWEEQRKRIGVGKSNPEIRFIDLRTPFLEIIERRGINPSNLQLPSDPHPNAEKHGILGDILASYLMEYR